VYLSSCFDIHEIFPVVYSFGAFFVQPPTPFHPMIQWLFPRIIGGKNERELSRIRPIVSRINEIERGLQREPAERLVERTRGWQEELSRVEVAGARAKHLERILPEAYAVVKNAARRLCGSEVMVNGHGMRWDMVHFDVQLIGGVALHRGMIAEMQTGEGKTLVATLPVYLNALTGLGVHVVTVNDYLAQRDSEWMGALFRSLGLTVGCIRNQMPPHERREAYLCDITYGTNSEFGFDYLKDNGIATTREEQVQRGHYLAIIDEVDSVLIDDARTPLIITGPSSRDAGQFDVCKPLVAKLVKRQTELCNPFAVEAKRLMEEGDLKGAGLALFKLKLGQPRNRQLLRMMEDPEVRRLLEKAELAYQKGAFQKDLFKIKEELYFSIDEKLHDADLSEKGRRFLAPNDPDSFTLPDTARMMEAIDERDDLTAERKSAAKGELRVRMDAQAAKIHGITQLLKAYCVYERDVHYVVRDGKVTIIDESTGREMAGRRWSDGLHQAVEAKEGVAVEKENLTYATITIQNYFRLYEKLAGMTGTGETEAAEFHDIYELDVLPIPTNAPNIRVDENDQIFKTRREKYQAVIARIEAAHVTGQPVLVGTASVEASETLSRMLKRAKIPHSVLNAKYHEQEAEIVALAGQKGAVTVSTNMAGRGTDIKLGEGVAELGGLLVIGTERHSSRRVDRQLRGRCSRQGDPGRSRFFISLEDDLMRHHASPEKMAAMIEQAGSASGKLVETAQRMVEQRDYRARKQVLDFDDVMNLQRGIVYHYRNEVLAAEDARKLVHDLLGETVPARVEEFLEESDPRRPDLRPLAEWLRTTPGVDLADGELDQVDVRKLPVEITERVIGVYDARVAGLPGEVLAGEVRRVLLSSIDREWQFHLEEMDELREGVYLRAQGQKDPLVEFKNEAYELFEALMGRMKQEAVPGLFRAVGQLEAFLSQIQRMAPKGGGKGGI
jgi:preprotein translocase subunit SecA